jgi:hypothetical protein
LLTSDVPNPRIVLSETSTPPPLSVLSQETYEREQIIKFFIGLEMLGEKKKQRFLLYLLSLKTPHTENQETKTDEL